MYAGWYVQMLGFADLGELPVAYADWYGEKPDYLAKSRDDMLPYPPPDEAMPDIGQQTSVCMKNRCADRQHLRPQGGTDDG